MLRQLDAKTLVAGQIAAADLPQLKRQGVTLLVNNRPDGEEPGQPTDAEMAQAAEAAGLSYNHVPMAGGLNAALVEDMAQALKQANGPVLAFCRSGTRSTFLWALARSQAGHPADELMLKAATAGYDLRPIAAYLSS